MCVMRKGKLMVKRQWEDVRPQRAPARGEFGKEKQQEGNCSLE